MSLFKQGRYSGLLRPLSYFLDLCIINGLALFVYFPDINGIVFISVISVSWILLSIASNFYEVYRYTREVTIISLLFKQLLLFTLITFAFSGFYREYGLMPDSIIKYVLLVFLLISIAKFAVFYLLQRYRTIRGGNYRKTVILGNNKRTLELQNFFTNNPEFGYVHKKTFAIKNLDNFSIEDCFRFIIEENIDEIYCSISELSNFQIGQVIDFADNNLKVLKFLPDNKEIYSKRLKYEYYNYIPVISLRNIPIDQPFNAFLKRTFDFIFSSLVIIFVLSWLTPILAILIKLESKGPVFFKQYRNGFNYREFECYKFRSMTPNDEAHLNQVTRGDERITKIGNFIRKTSIDELPQFFNVLFGDMSVVGPRPHMVSHTDIYARNIDKFMVRHFIKPGITGLAQISGYRGEVESENDIIGRVKHDIFYLENWSLLLDLKIIVKTFLNTVKGEDKAY